MKKKSFLKYQKLGVTKDENVEMVINLDSINYEKFIFKLKSDENIEDIEVTDEQVDIEKNNDEIIMEIDKKNNQLENITLSYSINDDKKVGDKIKFTATIINYDNEEETQSIETYIEIIEKNTDDSDQSKDEQNKPENNQTGNLENNKTENIENNKTEDIVNDDLKIEQPNNINNEKLTTNNSQKSASNIVVTESNKKDMGAVTYNGSNNNYLSDLSIENYDLNKEFTKENSTYFLEIENSIDKLNIIANSEDENATVCIYGNENLQTGNNKILISVTAENGNVRYYRIYINKKA